MSKLTLQLAMNPMEVSSGHIQSSEISTDRYFVARGFPITTEGHEEEKEFARRLVASFNACEGVPTETLEGEIFNQGLLKLSSTANEFARLKEQNAQLLDALRICREDINWMLNNREFLTGAKYDHIDRVIGEATTATAGEKIEAGDFVYISEDGKALESDRTKIDNH